MKRITALLLIVLCIIPLTTLTSCGRNLNEPISKSEAKKILNRRYGKRFSCVSDDLKDNGSGTVTFEDEDGIRCTYWVTRHDEGDVLPAYDYTMYENYSQHYYNAHPEYFAPLNDGVHKCEVDGYNNYTMFYDSYEDIDEVVDFTFNIINNIERVVEENDKSDIHLIEPSITFTCSSSKYEITTSIPYMPDGETNGEYKHFQSASDAVKSSYVKEVKYHNDPDEVSKLTNEQLSYDPINVIENITYKDKYVLDRMHFEENDGSRKNKHRGYSYYTQIRASDNYDNNQLIRLLKKAGWDVESEEKKLTFTNGEDILVVGKETIYFNGEPYEFDGRVYLSPANEQYEYYYSVLFTEKDFRDLFGIEFYFDQLKGTGEITKLGN